MGRQEWTDAQGEGGRRVKGDAERAAGTVRAAAWARTRPRAPCGQTGRGRGESRARAGRENAFSGQKASLRAAIEPRPGVAPGADASRWRGHNRTIASVQPTFCPRPHTQSYSGHVANLDHPQLMARRSLTAHRKQIARAHTAHGTARASRQKSLRRRRLRSWVYQNTLTYEREQRSRQAPFGKDCS